MTDWDASTARLEELHDASMEEPNEFGCCACREGSSPSDVFPALCTECGDELVALWAERPPTNSKEATR